MNNLENYFKLVDFLSDKNFYSCQEGKIIIECDESEIGKLKDNEQDNIYENFTEHNDIGYKTVDKNHLILGFLIYPSISFFSKEFRKLLSRSLIVYDQQNKNFYGWIDNKEYKNKKEICDIKLSFFYEITKYLEFEELWKTEANDTANSTFSFIDYYNQLDKTFLLVSTGSRTIINLPVVYAPLDFKGYNNINYGIYVSNFNDIVKNKSNNLFYFLKNEIIRRHNIKNANLLNIFKNFDSIYKSAYKSFLIYIEDISIEKLKDEYADFKNEYLRSYSDLISKILFKIISAPITFGAVTFALSRIDNKFLILILLLGLYSTSILVYYSLKSHLSDLISLTNQLETKCNRLKEKKFDFFKRYDDEIKELEITLNLIKEKISLSKIFLFSSFLMTFLFASMVGIYVLFGNLKKVLFQYDLSLFEGFDYLFLAITVIFILYSIYIAFNNYKIIKKFIKEIDYISFLE